MNIPPDWDSTNKNEVLKRTVYLVVGCPGSGKSWVCDQLQERFTYVHHDLFIGHSGEAYITAITIAAQNSRKPVLIEAPFSISNTKGPLEAIGFTVVPVVITEDDKVIEERYLARERKPIPKGHITRQMTYLQRAIALGWFHGTAVECLEHLRQVSDVLR